jgi:protease I
MAIRCYEADSFETRNPRIIMPRILIPIGDATEALDTFYPFFRLQEEGYESVVAGPQARLYHTVLHEIPPDSLIPWDITQERPGYFIRATMSFEEARGNINDFAGMFISGGRAPEYLRYDADLLELTRSMVAAGKPIACVCHGVEILTAAGVIHGRTVTTVAKCRLDAEQGGAKYTDREVVVDGQFITARTWHDNAHLMREFIKSLKVAERK